MPTKTTLLLALLLVSTGCAAPTGAGGPGGTRSTGGKGDDGDGEMRSGPRRWYVIGNDLTPGHDTLAFELEVPEGTDRALVRIDGEAVDTIDVEGGRARIDTDITSLAAGEHELTIVAPDAGEPLLTHGFVRSHPLYIVVSNDWDDTDNTDDELRRQEELHADHPELVLTHFVGPYTFTDPELPDARKRYLADWVIDMRDTYGDEIGLHIHPYCHFVESAGVTCRLEPEYARSWRTPGYTVYCGAYTEDEFVDLLRTADALFEEHGLGKPTSFRAGGWSLELHTLRALAIAGYVADTSANNWSRLEEWQGVSGTSLYSWNQMQWSTITETSQPWYPSESGLLDAAPPHVGVLEVPDNGILVDYVSAAEMIEMFQANFDGSALPEPRQYSIGYHPPSLTEEFKQRMDDALTHIDQHLLSQDDGPVVYARLSDLTRVWKLGE